jgi:hypothetical protein
MPGIVRDEDVASFNRLHGNDAVRLASKLYGHDVLGRIAMMLGERAQPRR